MDRTVTELLRPGLEIAPTINPHAVLFMKGVDVAVLALDEPGAPRTVHESNTGDVRNSGIAVARALKVAVFADGNHIIVVDANGRCKPLVDMTALIGSDCEINWELASDDALQTIYLTVVPEEAAQPLRILRLELSSATISELPVDYPDSAAYQIDATSGSVLWLATDESGGQQLVQATAGDRRCSRLTHRYDWVRVAPSADRVLLSRGVDVGPISVVLLNREMRELILPVQGHTASWAGPDKVLLHSPRGALELYTIGDSKSEPLITLSPPSSIIPGSVLPATASDDGRILAWSWIARGASGRQTAGTAIIDVVENRCRVLRCSSYRMAIVMP